MINVVDVHVALGIGRTLWIIRRTLCSRRQEMINVGNSFCFLPKITLIASVVVFYIKS